MAMNQLSKLLTEAASNLSGHPVRVRWRRPARADGRAMCFKLGDVAVIDLHPGLSWEGDVLLETIAHESAHVKLLWADWGAGIPDLPSGSVQPSKRAVNLPGVIQAENDADKLAADWIAAAKRNHMKYILPGAWNDTTTLYLRALANMTEKELKP